jgi:hypothetical protein
MTRLFWADWNKKAGLLRLFYSVMPDMFAGFKSVFRPAVGAHGVTGLPDIEEHPWMRAPQRDLLGRAVKRQVLGADFDLGLFGHRDAP